jgi:hypothetical protein
MPENRMEKKLRKADDTRDKRTSGTQDINQ